MTETTQGFSVEVSQQVIRCGCGDPATIHPDAVCPTPREIEDHGVIGTWRSTQED